MKKKENIRATYFIREGAKKSKDALIDNLILELKELPITMYYKNEWGDAGVIIDNLNIITYNSDNPRDFKVSDKLEKNIELCGIGDIPYDKPLYIYIDTKASYNFNDYVNFYEHGVPNKENYDLFIKQVTDTFYGNVKSYYLEVEDDISQISCIGTEPIKELKRYLTNMTEYNEEKDAITLLEISGYKTVANYNVITL